MAGSDRESFVVAAMPARINSNVLSSVSRKRAMVAYADAAVFTSLASALLSANLALLKWPGGLRVHGYPWPRVAIRLRRGLIRISCPRVVASDCSPSRQRTSRLSIHHSWIPSFCQPCGAMQHSSAQLRPFWHRFRNINQSRSINQSCARPSRAGSTARRTSARPAP